MAIIGALLSSPVVNKLIDNAKITATPLPLIITVTPVPSLTDLPTQNPTIFPPTPTAIPTSINTSNGCPQEMVLVPEGWFLFGGLEEDTDALADEKPPHRIYLPDFCIGRTEVSNREYRTFITKTFPNETPPPDNNYPAVNITWDEASAYCKALGGRLPTEMEWEKAARGDETKAYIFPWGDQYDNLKSNSNDLQGKYSEPVPVDKYPLGASPYGALNMSGNVAEWVWGYYQKDSYSRYPYELRMGLTPPESVQADNLRVTRGGSFADSPKNVRTSARLGAIPGNMRLPLVGFRCMAVPVNP